MSNVRSLNRVILIGNVGKNPEVAVTSGTGKDVAKFTLATKEGYYDANRVWKDSTEWHSIVAWGNLAKKAEKSVAKGDLVLIEGRIRSRKWTDKSSGIERTATDITADNLVVLEKKNKDGASADSSYSGSQYRRNNDVNAQSQDASQTPFDAQERGDDIAFNGEEDPF